MQEIVVSRGKIIELLRPDANTGKVHTLLTMEVFGIIRSLMAFRLTGGTKGVCVCYEMYVCVSAHIRKYSDPLTFPHFVTLQHFSKIDEENNLINLHTIPHNDKAKTGF